MSYHVNALWGLLVLVANVWAIVNIIQSSRDTAAKVLRIVLVIVLPVLGSIIWLVAGPRTGRYQGHHRSSRALATLGRGESPGAH